jgi:F-type H+-transporting ATPase subunit delta
VKSSAALKAYAKALLALAKERQQLDAVGRELALAVEAVKSDAELRTFLGRPGVPARAKRAVAEEIGKRLGLSKLTRDFLGLVADHGRGDQLEAIGEVFHGLVDADLGRVRATVRTAIPLTEAERSAIAARLSRALGGKQVLVHEVVDRNLLGGFVAEIGSLIMDGSLDGQLARMRQRLARG